MDMNHSTNYTIVYRGSETTFDAPNSWYSFGWLVGLVPFYWCLAWYFAQLFPGTQGQAKPFFFILDPVYWGLQKPKPPTIAGEADLRGYEQVRSLNDHSVRLKKLSKTYKNLQVCVGLFACLNCCLPSTLFALNYVCPQLTYP